MKNSLVHPRWSIWEALGVFALIVGCRWLFPLQKMTWLKQISDFISPTNPLLGQVFWSSFFLTAYFFLSIGLIIKFRYRLSWSEVGFRPGKEKGWLVMGIGHAFLLFVTMMVVLAVLSRLLAYEAKPQAVAEVFQTAMTGRERLLSFLMVAIIAPFGEELYFRGFLFPAVGKIIGTIPAVILTSIFFGFLHFDLFRFIPITLVGIWFNFLYLRTGSLYTSIVAHSVWNALTILMFFLAQSIGVS
ncbi:MAG TPA: CPBP family intramembrane metalloprotease [Clostridia bacterium]|jgi:membrane protease YdiL (CAAX protease family)|nr:CPBP family intramembrane metalloprotease [Clostridia bacterium]